MRLASDQFEEEFQRLDAILSGLDRAITSMCQDPVPREAEALQSVVLAYRRFDSDVHEKEPEVEEVLP